MLKQFLQKILQGMTKVTNELPTASAAETALHHVQAGKVEKAEPAEKKVRIKNKRYAMLLSYQGKEYFGMQFQKDHPTIESNLIEAMHKLGWITDEEKDKPFNFFFQRAARTDKAVSAVRQICGMQLRQLFDFENTGPVDLNNILPKDIRVIGIRRTIHSFHPQKHADARTYSYTLPTFAFAKSDELTNSSFRIPKETIDDINSILDIYIGTHNFFNYTSKKSFKDASCNRYIHTFTCGEPFLYKDTFRNKDVEFISLTVKGQSFILHQIRKMVGMLITIIRELQMKSYIQKSFECDRIDVPMAPGLGLLLERVHYDNYDKKYATNDILPITNWGESIEAEIEKIKYDLITKEILDTEITSQSMLQWLAELPRHDFACDPERDEAPKKSFLTMACAQANNHASNEHLNIPEVNENASVDSIAEKTATSDAKSDAEEKKEAVA